MRRSSPKPPRSCRPSLGTRRPGRPGRTAVGRKGKAGCSIRFGWRSRRRRTAPEMAKLLPLIGRAKAEARLAGRGGLRLWKPPCRPSCSPARSARDVSRSEALAGSGRSSFASESGVGRCPSLFTTRCRAKKSRSCRSIRATSVSMSAARRSTTMSISATRVRSWRSTCSIACSSGAIRASPTCATSPTSTTASSRAPPTTRRASRR